MQQLFIVHELSYASAIVTVDFVVPVHFLVELDAHLENFLEIVLVVVKQLVHLAIADQNNFRVHVDRLGLQRRAAERKKHVDRLNFELAVIQCALQSSPHARLGHGVESVHHQEPAVRAQQRAAAQVHKVGIPASARVVAAMHRAEKVRVRGNRLENHWALVVLVVRQLDNATAADVTAQTLTQIILEEGRKGTSLLPSELLHDLVRMGERAVSSGVEHVQHGVDRLVQASVDRLGPVRRAREEMSRLKARLEDLETSLTRLETEPAGNGTTPEARTTPPPKPERAARRRGA